MDFSTKSELRRTSAKALLTCTLCSQYFDDPRLLPCGHTFCRRCLQKYFDQKQAGSSIRVGRLTCPRCKTMIGIPPTGVEAFPVDKKVSRIKDLVIDELAENISKNIHSQSQSDTLSSHSDRTDSGDFADMREDNLPKRSDFSSRSRSRLTSDKSTSDESDKTSSNGGFMGNSMYPNMAKYAKYFVKDEESSSTEGYTPRFRPAISAERRRVGYSSSFQHRRRRINIEPPKGYDDAADILRQSRYGSAPHIGRQNVSNTSSSYNDIFGNLPQSSEELGASRNHRSRSSTKYENMKDSHHSTSRAKANDDEFGSATASMPSLLKTRSDGAAGIDPGVVYTALRNNFSEPKFDHSSGVKAKAASPPANGFHANDVGSERTWKSPQDGLTSKEKSDKSGISGERTQGKPHTSSRDKLSQNSSTASDKSKTSLPIHRENIVTSSPDEKEEASPGVRLREEAFSRVRATPRPHSDYFSDRMTSHREVKPEPTFHKTGSTESVPSGRSFRPRSPLLGKSKRNLSRVPSDNKYSECKTEEYHSKIPKDKEKVPGWYQDAPQSKKRDENFARTKPDDAEVKAAFLKPETPKFRKSASFTSNSWQEGVSHAENYIRNAGINRMTRRKTYYRNINGSSSSGNLNQFDFSIKFELKNRRKLKKSSERVVERNGNVSGDDDDDDDRQSEIEQRNAFNERILNMRMNKYHYDNIMSAFKDGNLCSDENLNDLIDDVTGTDDNLQENTNETNADAQVTSVEDSDVAHASFTISSESLEKQSDKDASESQTSNETSAKPVPEEVGHNLTEMINSMRTKYQAQDVVDDGLTTAQSVVLQPVCCETVVPKWNFQKTEFSIPTSITITSKGCTVVADYGNSCLEFFDSDGNYEHKIDGIKPFSIVANKRDQIIVGDRKGKAIRIFDEYGADVAQWEGGLFSWISGIALLESGNVVVYDRDRCKVGIYSSGGEKIKEFASYGAHDSQLCMADFLTVDRKNRIIVADSGNHCLKIFDTDGKFICKVAGRGTEDGCLEWPKGVCVDSMDNILVADSQNNRVSMFSPSGQFVQHLVTSTPSPYSICFSSSSNLLGVTHYALTGFSQYDVYQCLQ